jgi:hypothetical protein
LTDQARVAARSIDDFIVDALNRSVPPPIDDDLPVTLQIEFKAMEALSDEALWAIAQSHMNEDKVALYDLLLERRQTGDLTTEGQELLDDLRSEADFLMVRKAHAYALLKSRGHQLPLLAELHRA